MQKTRETIEAVDYALLYVSCPICGARAMEPCQNEAFNVHQVRWELAKREMVQSSLQPVVSGTRTGAGSAPY